jgi:hypothetical protein
VVLTCGPSAVITRNFASGSLSPTWIVIVNSPWMCGDVLKHFPGGWKAVHHRFELPGKHQTVIPA